MPTLGINDLKQYALPAGIDAAYLRNVSLQSGETYEQLISEIAAALELQNAAILSDPLYGGLVSVTEEVTIEYRVGTTAGFEPHTEYGEPNAKRSAVTGHMLPLDPWDRKFGWTWDFLRKARRSQIDADIRSGMEDVRNLYQKKILERLFKSTYTSVGSGKSMPLADGGTADSTFVPIAVPSRGGTFTSSHNHFKFLNGITQANLQTAVDTLWEHGIDGPYEMTISQADMASWSNTTNVTGWTPRAAVGIAYGANTQLTTIDETYIGAITVRQGVVYVRATGRIPTNYYELHKSYGNADSRNPLVIRVGSAYGLGAVLLGHPGIRKYPLENAIMFAEFGVGVQDRIAAVAVFNTAGGSYTDPVIA